MLFLVVFRAFELKIGRDIISSNFRQRSDNFVLFIWDKIAGFFVGVWKKIVFNVKRGLSYVFHLFVSVWEFFVHKSAKYIDIIRGRNIHGNGGKIAYFADSDDEIEDLQN